MKIWESLGFERSGMPLVKEMPPHYSIFMVAVPVIKKKHKNTLTSFLKYKLILEYFQNQSEHSAKEKNSNGRGPILYFEVGGPCDI